MRSICVIILLIASINTALAVKAYPRPVIVRQPDGSTLTLIIRGDEHFRYTMTADGRTVAKGKDGFFYYASYSPSGIEMSKTKASSSISLSSTSLNSIGRTEENMRAAASAFRSKSLSRLSAAGGIMTLSPAASKTVRVLVIPVEFSDLKFSVPSPKDHFFSMLNTPGYSERGGTGSAKDYFEDNMPGWTFTFDVTDPVTLSQSYTYYGTNDISTPSVITYDANLNRMVSEACKSVDPSVNFKDYDNDGDGQADFIFFYFAGYNEAESGDDNTIWPQVNNISSEGITCDGTRIGMFACASELAGSDLGESSSTLTSGIGTFCHEFGHFLGLVDLYDTDYGSGGMSQCLWGRLSVMDEGNFNNSGRTPPNFCAIDRELAGSANYINVRTGSTVSLSPIGSSGDIIRIPTSNNGEYFLIENRDNSGWDAYIDGYGMAVYHVDKSSNIADGISAATRWTTNLVNASASHECADMIEAYSKAEHISQIFFPGQAGITELSASGDPAFIAWDGTPAGVKLANISVNSGTVTFDLVEDSSEVLLTPVGLEVEAYQNRAVATWKAGRYGTYRWGIIWGETSFGKKPFRDTAVATRYTFEHLTPRTEYFCLMYHIGERGNGDTVAVRFSTMPLTSPYPYIYSKRINYFTNDTIDLVVNNIAENVNSTIWYINGTRALSDRYVFRQPGEYTVKAVIEYASDKSTETVIKTITVTDAIIKDPDDE